jgi:hypothetical protein
MIQFNLLPDVKLEYIKARRTKRLVLMASTIVTGVALAILVVLFIGVNVLQKQHLSNLAEDIEADSKKLQEIEGLDKILTVQNQLNGLNDLHAKKPVASRLGTYFTQLIPNQITVEKLEVDFDGTTMTFEGAGSGVDAVNKFIDTLKFTTFQADNNSVNAFSSVVLEEFSRDEKKATYKITLKFDPRIFDSSSEVKLEVPTRISTRSVTEKPEELFEDTTPESDAEETQDGQQADEFEEEIIEEGP